LKLIVIRTIEWLLIAAALAAPARAALTASDDTGSRVALDRPARRVVSLAPSTTEMLFAIAAGPSVVGVSGADDYPPLVKALPKIGSFSGPDLERITAARPDLVVAAYGNPLEVVNRLRRLGLPVYVSNPTTVAGVLRNLADLGRLTGHDAAAGQAVRGLEERLRRVAARVRGQPAVKTLVVIWDEPLTVAGGRSFIQDILRRAGGVNAAAGLAEAYPKLDPERLLLLDPAVVLFPVDDSVARAKLTALQQRPGFRQTVAARSGRFFTLNPDWLMRAGPRVVLGVEAVAQRLHPSLDRRQTSHRLNTHRVRRILAGR
jgi:iron complex transport system substrate-binding protein